MGGNVEAYYDSMREGQYRRKQKEREERIKAGGCKQSSNGVHCGHRRSTHTHDTIIRCCYCDVLAPCTLEHRLQNVKGHGKHHCVEVSVVVFDNPQDEKLWTTADLNW